MIEVIVFDLDDTLFPECEFIRSGFVEVSQWLYQNYNILNFFEVSWNLYQNRMRGNIFNLALEQLKVKYRPTLIEELLKVYRMHKPNITLHDDARWAIEYFSKSKRLGMITDGYLATQRNKVAALEIESYFDVIVYSDFFGKEHWKPSPLPYQKMVELMRYQDREMVYIGDNPHKDFITARKMGWKTIQVIRCDGEYAQAPIAPNYQAEHQVTSLYQLVDICS